MLTGLKLYHRASGAHKDIQLESGFWHLGTCMRSIILTFDPKDFEDKSYQRYLEKDAYCFLLEVICGLHSPLLGETEILGQFKSFVKENENSFNRSMAQLVLSLGRDAKKIRTQLLQNLGCQSYGSLIRKNINSNAKNICFLGAGQLTQEILPWISKTQLDCDIYTRSPEKYVESFINQTQCRVFSYQNIINKPWDVLVVAAPLDSQQISKFINLSQVGHIFDLRGTSDVDPLLHKNYSSLKKLFGHIEKNKENFSIIRSRALAMASDLTQQKLLAENPRPFGWDDIWAYS